MYGRQLTLSAAMAAVVSARSIVEPLQSRQCAPGFKNIVFNSDVNNQPDIVGRFSTIQSYGIDKWVGFTLDNAQPDSPILNDNQLKLVISDANIPSGIDIVTGPNPPQYLGILNEPDGGFYDLPIYTPQEAVDLVQPFLNAETSTTYLSPAPAFPKTEWLTDFFALCDCDDKFPIISTHVYDVSAEGAIQTIQTVMDQFPGKPIWITEISPASDPAQGCQLDGQGMVDWMNEVIGWAAEQPAVERIFWNCGEYGTLYPENPGQCNPSLTEVDGRPTALLEALGQIC